MPKKEPHESESLRADLGEPMSTMDPQPEFPLPHVRIDPAHAPVGAPRSDSVPDEVPIVAEWVAGAAAAEHRSPVLSQGRAVDLPPELVSEVPPRVATWGPDPERLDPERLHAQAGQLARHLQDRRREVDTRESLLNARLAQLENDLRNSRLWLREQQTEFNQWEESLRQEKQTLDQRSAALAVEQLALHESQRQFASDSQRREELLARREFEVQEAQQRLAAESQRLQEERHAVAELRRELDARQARAPSREAAVGEQLHELQRLAAGWRQQLEVWQAESQAERAALDAERDMLRRRQQQWNEERDQQRQALTLERQAQIQRQATLTELREELVRIHRESLELRLVIEQLWNRLGVQASPEQLTTELSRYQGQLADSQRLAHEELVAAREELGQLVQRLELKQRQLRDQRRELVSWFQRQDAEFSRRGDELTGRERRLAEAQAQWRSEQATARDELLARVTRVAVPQADPPRRREVA